MKKILFLTCLFCLTLLNTHAQTSASKAAEFEMKTYYLVFLKKGPNRTQDSTTAAQIQEQHLAHLRKMYEEKHLCIAGPLMDNSDIRGICVYHTASLDEAKTMAEADPAVKAGRLIVEIHPWYAAKGSSLP